VFLGVFIVVLYSDFETFDNTLWLSRWISRICWKNYTYI